MPSKRSGFPHAAAHPLLALALATACAPLGCSQDDAPVIVETATASRGRIERIVVATGTVEPEGEVTVRPRISGILERIFVAEGDDVEKGQPLAQIERELLEARVREADATLRQARIEYRFAKIEVDRQRELKRSGAASDQTRDAALLRYEGASAAVARAQAVLDTLSTELAYAEIESPLKGRVLSIPIEEGSAVSGVTAVTGGTVIMSLAGTDTLFLEGKVDENEVARVAVGQPARIRTEAFSDRTFEGIVREIAPVGERVQNVTYFEVKIEITDPDAGLLRPRMSGDADIVSEVVESALTVPETAIRYRGDQIYVEKLVPGERPTLENTDVTVGIVDGNRVQILDGLTEGTEVRLR